MNCLGRFGVDFLGVSVCGRGQRGVVPGLGLVWGWIRLWPSFEQEVGLDDLPRYLPNLLVLWIIVWLIYFFLKSSLVIIIPTLVLYLSLFLFLPLLIKKSACVFIPPHHPTPQPASSSISALPDDFPETCASRLLQFKGLEGSIKSHSIICDTVAEIRYVWQLWASGKERSPFYVVL